MAVGALTPLTALPVWKLSSWTDFVANSSILVVKPLMLSLCHGRGITIGSLLHHTWCLVYCATCATDVKTEPSWSQNGLLRPGGPSLPSMVPGMVLWQHPWESNLWGGLFIPGATAISFVTAGVPSFCLLALKLCFSGAHVFRSIVGVL